MSDNNATDAINAMVRSIVDSDRALAEALTEAARALDAGTPPGEVANTLRSLAAVTYEHVAEVLPLYEDVPPTTRRPCGHFVRGARGGLRFCALDDGHTGHHELTH